MNKWFKKQSGIALSTLSVAIILMIIISSVLVYNAKDNLYTRNLKNLYNDMENVREKVISYYSQYGKLPIITEKEYIVDETSELYQTCCGKAEENGKFYVIDLKTLDGVTLNYGKDYERVEAFISDDTNNLNELKDIFIINEKSLNVFYAKGITIDGKTYYTDKAVDNVEVGEFKYYDGVRIPEGYEYVSGTKATGLKIKKKNTTTDDEQYYVWVVVNEKIKEKPEVVKVGENDEYEFIQSVNANGGYFLYNGDVTTNVVYIPLDLTGWTDKYPAGGGYYTDKNGDVAYIPEGYRVSMTLNMNTVYNGLVIRDDNENQFVWIAVPKKVTQNASTDEEIETCLKAYVSDYQDKDCIDSWFSGCGLTQEEYNTQKVAMLRSIKEHGGFYISRYEIGDETTSSLSDKTVGRTSVSGTSKTAVSKTGMHPYNYLTIGEAQGLASAMAANKNVNGSLLFGVQWDLVCKFIETTGSKLKVELINDSSKWGDYLDSSQFKVVRGRYSSNNGSTWINVSAAGYVKKQNEAIMLTTGATERNFVSNIYDLAGNVYEMTLERVKDASNPAVYRGRRI